MPLPGSDARDQMNVSGKVGAMGKKMPAGRRDAMAKKKMPASGLAVDDVESSGQTGSEVCQGTWPGWKHAPVRGMPSGAEVYRWNVSPDFSC